jgi:hypothetical protein
MFEPNFAFKILLFVIQWRCLWLRQTTQRQLAELVIR